MYGKKTLITDFIVEFITDFYLVKVSNKVHNKVCNESQLPTFEVVMIATPSVFRCKHQYFTPMV